MPVIQGSPSQVGIQLGNPVGIGDENQARMMGEAVSGVGQAIFEVGNRLDAVIKERQAKARSYQHIIDKEEFEAAVDTARRDMSYYDPKDDPTGAKKSQQFMEFSQRLIEDNIVKKGYSGVEAEQYRANALGVMNSQRVQFAVETQKAASEEVKAKRNMVFDRLAARAVVDPRRMDSVLKEGYVLIDTDPDYITDTDKIQAKLAFGEKVVKGIVTSYEQANGASGMDFKAYNKARLVVAQAAAGGAIAPDVAEKAYESLDKKLRSDETMRQQREKSFQDKMKYEQEVGREMMQAELVSQKMQSLNNPDLLETFEANANVALKTGRISFKQYEDLIGMRTPEARRDDAVIEGDVLRLMIGDTSIGKQKLDMMAKGAGVKKVTNDVNGALNYANAKYRQGRISAEKYTDLIRTIKSHRDRKESERASLREKLELMYMQEGLSSSTDKLPAIKNLLSTLNTTGSLSAVKIEKATTGTGQAKGMVDPKYNGWDDARYAQEQGVLKARRDDALKTGNRNLLNQINTEARKLQDNYRIYKRETEIKGAGPDGRTIRFK